MKKRILSAALALCMLLLSVPFVALTAFGAAATVELPDEKEYKFVGTGSVGVDEGLPSFTDTRKTAFTYPEGWLLGMKDPADVGSFTTLNAVSTQTKEALVVAGNENLAISTGGGFATQGVSKNRFTVTKTASGTVRFTSPYSGTATVTLESLAGTNKATAFVVLVNGTPVWPAGAVYSDTSTWYELTNKTGISTPTAVATAITLNYGDTVEFVNAHIDTANDSTSGMSKLNVTVKLTDITARGTKSTLETNGMMFVDGTVPKPYNYKLDGAEDYYFADKAAYREYLEDFGLVNYTGGWTNGVINKSTGAFEKIGRVMFYVDRCFSATNDREILFDNRLPSAFDDMKWLITDKYFDEALEYVFNNPGLKKAPWVEGVGTQIHLSGVKVSQSRPTQGTHFAYTYESNMSGMASVSIPAVVMDANPATFSSIYLAVAVNGAVVWPANATAQTTTNWYDALETSTSNTDAAIAEAIGDLSFYVNEGDRIMFLVAVEYKNWSNSFQKVDGSATNTAIAVNPSVEISADETTVLQKEVIFKNQMGLPVARHTVEEGAAMPALPGYVATKYLVNGTEAALPATVTENLVIQPIDDHSGFASRDLAYTIDNSLATFPGPWKPVTGTFDENTALINQVYTDDTTWNYLEDLANYSASNAGFIGSDGMNWYQGRGLYNTTNRMLGIRPLAGYGVGLMFTAPSTGYIDLSFETLKVVRPNGGTEGTLACYFAIYLNGEIIWPAKSNPDADGAFYFESENTYLDDVYGAQEDMLAAAKEFEAFPTNLFVNTGDELSIIFSMGNNSCNGAFCDATVSYTQVYAKPEVDLSVSVGEEFGLNLQVNAPADASEVGISVRDNLLPLTAEGGVYKYSYPAVVAKKMVDTQTFTPYYKSADGQIIYGEEITVSVADVLNAYVTSEETSEAVKNFAIAALNYGARAQTYFSYKPTNLANKNLTTDQKQLAAIGDSGKALVNTAKDGATAEIIGAALILDKQIEVKYFINTNVSGLSLQVADNADFTDADTVALEQRNDGNYKAFVEVALADLGDDMYVRVVDGDGNVVSNTVQYSVVAYATRMESNLYMADLVKAIYALANAAAALTA